LTQKSNKKGQERKDIQHLSFVSPWCGCSATVASAKEYYCTRCVFCRSKRGRGAKLQS